MKRLFTLLFPLLLVGCSAPYIDSSSAASNPHIDSIDSSEKSIEPKEISQENSQHLPLHVVHGEVRLFMPHYEKKASYTLMLDRDDRPIGEPEDACGISLPSDIFTKTDFTSVLPGDRSVGEVECSDEDFYIYDTCAAELKISSPNVLSEKVEKASIREIMINEGIIEDTKGIDFSMLFSEKAINEEGLYVPLSSISKGYVTISAAKPGVARAIYTYNPRP